MGDFVFVLMWDVVLSCIWTLLQVRLLFLPPKPELSQRKDTMQREVVGRQQHEQILTELADSSLPNSAHRKMPEKLAYPVVVISTPFYM